MEAVGQSHGVIEFELDGTIITANPNFLAVTGYTLDEIRGRHHSLFLEQEDHESEAYEAFWASLRKGDHQTAQYRRVGKGGREVWIQASYNPLIDLAGRPFKVVKFATDITAMKLAQIEATKASCSTLLNVQTVASAAEELSASSAEIAENMSRSRLAVSDIQNLARGADGSTVRLRDAASSMGGLVGLIQNVGQQINLLSLNATIEAVRAGEAGRGFAVVAGEVKNLSDQVTGATTRISTDIEAMQHVAEEVFSSLGAIGRSIDSIQVTVTGVASAVDEQSAVTWEISMSMQTAALSVADVDRNLQLMARVA